MDESGVDLSYDESTRPAPQPRMMSVQPRATMRPPTSTERIRVVVGPRQTPSSLPTNMSSSLGKTKLRSAQRLQLMKLQAEAEVNRVASSTSIQKKSSSSDMSAIPSTANSSFLANFTKHSFAFPSSSSSIGLLPNLNEYMTTPSMQMCSKTDDDEDELLRDIDGVLEEELSSYDSTFSIPSVANSCMVDFSGDLQDVHMEEDKGHTSSSCPLIPLRPADPIPPYRGGRKKEPPPVFLTEESKVQWMKERDKKDQHNTIEKKRRTKINDYIQEMATLLPESYDIDLQNKKGNILEASVDYIRKLQNDEKRMLQMKKQQDELERQNRKLQLQIQFLQMTMNASHAGQSPAQIPEQQPALSIPDSVQVNNMLGLHDAHDLDLLPGDLDMLPDGFDLAQLDPIFDGIQVEALSIPAAASGSDATGVSQIPVMVDEMMEDFNL